MKEKVEYHEDGSFTLQYQQKVDDLVASNHALRESGHDFYTDDRSGKLQARIPMVTYLKLKQTGVIDDPVKLRRWLNDPDNAAFTFPNRSVRIYTG